MGLSWGVGYYLTQYLFEKKKFDSTPLLKLFLGIFLFSWLGAKVFFLIFSSQHKIYQYLYADYFWLGGGFVFYGGLIFGLIFYLIYSKIMKKFDIEKSYILIPGLIFGHAIGRIGCFLTGCCYGLKSQVPWSVYMSGEYRHPVQLYEAILLIILGFMSLSWIKSCEDNFKIVTNYVLAYSIIRFFLEFLRGDEIRGFLWFSLSTSQFISIGLFFCAFLAKASYKKFTTPQ